MNPLNTVNGTIVAGVVLAILVGLATMGIEFQHGEFPGLDPRTCRHHLDRLALLLQFRPRSRRWRKPASDEGGPGGAGITKYVAPRALWWFRWGAVVTWLSGAAYLLHLGLLDDAFLLGINTGSGAAMLIGVGAWLGTIMLFNVWALIWPNQKKILGMVEASADEIAKARRVAFVASRTNTMLSIPMLMSMVGYGHGGFFI